MPTMFFERTIKPLSVLARRQVLLAKLLEDERGQGLTEYALILSLIAIVALAALAVFGGQVTTVLSSVASSI
jgi:Flp pilus assembly pilin Flp